ncbi:hypothetical protein MOBT1_000442 [Malassezia obtusa]|uniref:ferric-chelate reductase (NADPH) n=1 Tax=Malassezia obtusa TaxID=76774 RepID=A0AAF0DY38_9BASI|nr:hypothetical protein MOBT1_000442 [Malassezia obtusa]
MRLDDAGAARARRAPPGSLVEQGMTYLGAHELSPPSERYVYIFWFLLAGMAAVLGIEHLTGLMDRTPLGALWCKWATSNHVARVLRAPRADAGAPPSATRRIVQFFQRHAFLSFNLGRLTAMVVILLPVLCLTLIGYDYIDPRRGMFELPATTKGAAVAKRGVRWGRGDAPRIMFTKPDGTLPYHTWWTIGSRAGDMSNALTPLVVLFALKQVPFALLALPVFGGFSLDSLGFLHKWAGYLLWVYATVHTLAWIIQVAKDKAELHNIWTILTSVPRFRWAITAYIFLTLLVIFSITPFRRAHYEVFYVVHVVCVLGFMIATWAHHPQLGWWMLAALLLWGLERLTRIVRVMWINYSEKPAMLREPQHTPVATHEPGLYSTETLGASHLDVSRAGLDSPMIGHAGKGASASRVDLDVEATPKWPGADLGGAGSASQLDLGAPGTAHVDLGAAAVVPSQTPRHSAALSASPSGSPRIPVPLAVPFRSVISDDLRMQLYPGYAFIQPLAGNMMRLVLRTASPLQWRPGQWLYLQIPHLSVFQSHPFTIASSFTKRKHDRIGRADDTDVDQLVLLLIRVRGGLTRRLWEYIQRKSVPPDANSAARGIARTFPVLGAAQVPSQVRGVYLRAIVDGPFGSSARVDWGAYKSVVIVCGGSGVSFGMSVLEHLCREIARALQGEDVRGLYGRPFHLRRVCFVWVMREFAHVQWAASALRLCLEMLPPEHLQVQLFVTHVNQQRVVETASPPGSPPMRGRPDAAVATAPSTATLPVFAPPLNAAAQVVHGDGLDHVALGEGDLTQFDQETEGPLTALDRLMNEHIMRIGKLRRAKSRKRSMRRRGRTQSPPRSAGASGFARHHADEQARHELQHSARHERPITTPGSLMAFTEHAFGAGAPGAEPRVGTPGSDGVSDGAPAQSPAPVVSGGSPEHALSPTHVAPAQDYFSLRPHGPGAAETPKPLSLAAETPGPVSSADAYPPAPGTPPASPPMHSVAMPDADDEPMLANLDPDEIADFEVVAELTRAGYPKFDEILAREIGQSDGRTMTAVCGPAGLLAVVRAVVAEHIRVVDVWRGDQRGHANLYGESYDT